ncbi:MAG: DNA-directed RNA polymerase subunit alpha C-terminal domain-containing protein [Planctomycetales bacterium]
MQTFEGLRMVKVAEPIDARELLRGEDTFGTDAIARLDRALSTAQLGQIRQELLALQQEVDSGKADKGLMLRAGIGAFLFGQHRRAVHYLEKVVDDPNGCFYLAQALFSLERYADAAERFDQAAKLGYDKLDCTLRRAGALRCLGQVDQAEELIRSVASKAAGRAEYSYQMGCIFDDRGDMDRAVEYYERAVDMDQFHSRAQFRLAALNSLHGNDDEAIRRYEQSLSKPPLHLGALLNLGLLYEDKSNYAAAAYCFRRILESDPMHPRANLYLRDIEATSDMYYDEESARHEARLAQLLSRPITDFELSVRSRNCLQGMNIYTLGDLTHVTEQDLLGGKNFGETSLAEIREVLGAHGLRVGQNLHKALPDFRLPPIDLSPQEQAVLNTPISELNLSVRARKCMSRLGITTLGELVHRTPDELLSSRNFGVTSLNEIRAKLGEQGMKLRND